MHIVKYIQHEITASAVNIFTKLIDSLLDNLHGLSNTYYYPITFNHILHALNYLDQNLFIYQDVKPTNILYKATASGHYFQLGDFGICNKVVSIKTYYSISLYIAPEVYARGRQLVKADIQLLAVTIFNIRDKYGFYLRLEALCTRLDLGDLFQQASQQDIFNIVRAIANKTPFKDLKVIVAFSPL